MPLPELLDELFRVYRRHFALIAAISLILVLPGLIWTLVTGTFVFNTAALFNGFQPGTVPSIPPQVLADIFRWFGLTVLGAILLLPLSVGALNRVVVDVIEGRVASIPGVLLKALSRYFPFLGLILITLGFLILWWIACVIGLILLVLPVFAALAGGLFFVVRWSMSAAAMTAEDIGPIRGMGRSWRLVSGMWWRTLGILAVLLIMWFIIYLALRIMFGALVGVLVGGYLGFAITSVLLSLVNGIVSPIVTIGIVLLYYDLRTRKEGLDLDQLARQTSPGPAPA
jgi:hypothetical protein